MEVVIKSDTFHTKEFEVTDGGRTWNLTVDREFIDNYKALWRWRFSRERALSLFVYMPDERPRRLWPTWEQALEDALDEIMKESGEDR